MTISEKSIFFIFLRLSMALRLRLLKLLASCGLVLCLCLWTSSFAIIKDFTLLCLYLYQMPSFLRISFGMAFLLTMKSIVLAMMKVLVIYQMPL